MASVILSGTPQKATSYTTSSTETPKWMQDAIYNQIQMAQQAAAIPYQDFIPGVGETSTAVAQLSPHQQLLQIRAVDTQNCFWTCFESIVGDLFAAIFTYSVGSGIHTSERGIYLC